MKWRVSYEKKQRERAKREKKGLITLDIVKADGGRSNIQIIASAAEVTQMEKTLLGLIDGEFK